jgi:hypothetical protein
MGDIVLMFHIQKRVIKATIFMAVCLLFSVSFLLRPASTDAAINPQINF